MRIESASGELITSMEDWAGLYDTPRERIHWKEGRSAHAIADFMLQRGGAERLRGRVAAVVGQDVTFARGVPEHEIRFDEFGRGRVHDLGIFGATASGQSIFVGVEAKVDEPFNSTVREAYLQAKAKEIAGIPTNAPRRIEQLLKASFVDPNPAMFDVRYQLLYATAGTIAAGADVSVLYVAVFKTHLFDEVKGADNFRDYVDYMKKASAEFVEIEDKSAVVSRLRIDGRDLYCLYEYF